MTIGPTGPLTVLDVDLQHIGTNYTFQPFTVHHFVNDTWSIATTLKHRLSLQLMFLIPCHPWTTSATIQSPSLPSHHSQHLLFSSSAFIPHPNPHNLFHLIRSTHPIRSIPLQPNGGHKQATPSVHVPSFDSIPRGLPHMYSRIGEGRSSPAPP